MLQSVLQELEQASEDRVGVICVEKIWAADKIQQTTKSTDIRT
jgi:hypothetical protein